MIDANNEVYFHEDDYCQQEILPLAALDFCRNQITEIDEFATSHKVPGGIGWTEMFMRENSPEKLSDLGITFELFRAIMKEHLPELPIVYTGYSSYREQCQRTIGFGHHDDCIIYADWNDREIVEHVWTGIFTIEEAELANVVSALQSFGRQFPLIYVDWAWSFVTPLDQSKNLHNRLASKIAEIARRMKEQG